MKDYQSLSHTKWDCKYHVVFIPKYRRKKIFGTLRQHLGEIFRRQEQEEERLEQLNMAWGQQPPSGGS